MGIIKKSNQGRFLVSGVLTFATVTKVFANSKNLFKDAPDHLVIDLTEVERADSAGLALLVEWLAVATHLNRTLTFEHVPEQLTTLASMCSVDKILFSIQ